jgi:hypothetical protein
VRRVAAQHSEYAPLRIGVGRAYPKEDAAVGELCIEERFLILAQSPTEQRADGPDPASRHRRGGYRCSGYAARCHSKAGRSQACNGRGKAGAEDPSLTDIGVGDGTFARRRRIVCHVLRPWRQTFCQRRVLFRSIRETFAKFIHYEKL